jgi:hypothetical protein
MALYSKLLGLKFVTCSSEILPAWSYDDCAGFMPHALRELGTFAEEAIAWMDGVDGVLAC